MLEFAPKSAANNQADQRPQEEEVSSNASIKFVVAEDLSKAPSYLRAQFDCDTLNEMLKEVNVFLAEVCMHVMYVYMCFQCNRVSFFCEFPYLLLKM